MRTSWSLVLLLAACGASSSRPLGVRENLDEAHRHDEDARRLDDTAATMESNVLRDAGAPSWSREAAVVRQQREEADRLRADAAAHRARASALVAAEQASCAAMPAAELSHTPFAHRDDIVAVTAALDGDELRGAVVRFRWIPGLTAAWMRLAITCHQARAAALGFDVKYMAYDPSVLAGVKVEVLDDGDGPIVEIRSDDDETALRLYLRAEALLEPIEAP